MEGLFRNTQRLCQLLSVGAGIALVFMMCLTIADVILRAFNRPLIGTYEIVAFSGAVVMGLVNPLTSWNKSHILTDFLILKFSERTRKVFQVSTRILAIWLFAMIGWNLIAYGMQLRNSLRVSATLAIPFYPIAYGLGVSAFIQCLVFIADILRTVGDKHE